MLGYTSDTNPPERILTEVQNSFRRCDQVSDLLVVHFYVRERHLVLDVMFILFNRSEHLLQCQHHHPRLIWVASHCVCLASPSRAICEYCGIDTIEDVGN